MSDATPATAPHFEHAVRSRVSEIAHLLEALARWGETVGVPLPVLSRMELMLDELVTNIIVHGYRHDHGRIELQAQVLGQALHVTLRDYAFAYDPLQAPEPDTALALEDRSIGGLGVHFVRRMADQVHYQRVLHHGQEANELHIVKRF